MASQKGFLGRIRQQTVPDTRFLLHFMEEEQDEQVLCYKQVLCYHGEKLLVVSNTINVASQMSALSRNLSMWCLPLCHKVHIQDCVARNFIARYTNSHHHFQERGCACGYYW